MANTYLHVLGINDTLQDVIRKVNFNFQRVATDQTAQTNQGLRQEASRTDAALDGIIGEINNAVANGLKELQDKFDELIEQVVLDATPKVGTYIMCDYDPNEQWSDTTWDQLEDIDYTDIPIWKRTE